MSMKYKMLLLFVIDMAIVSLSIATSYILRFDAEIPPSYTTQMLIYGLISIVICGVSMNAFGMYRRLWRYASVGEIVAIGKAVMIGGGASYLISSIVMERRIPFSVALATTEMMLLLMGGIRFAWRAFRSYSSKSGNQKTNALIFGAGNCGALIAKEISGPNLLDRKLIGFIDDDLTKQGLQIHGCPVLGDRSQISELVDMHDIKEIIIAIPSAPRKVLSELINLCIPTGVKIRMIPGIIDLIDGKITVQTIRDVDVADLLGRDSIQMDMQGISEYLLDKVVLVTGAGGSIGSELSRQIATFSPKKLLLLGHGENSIYSIEMELRRKYPEMQLEPIIADIQHLSRMEEVFKEYRPHVVFHAAAHKHVPLMERNPSEAVKNNVFGTRNVADCARKFGSDRFVLISTDKAVNPSSVMGTTKRIAEMYIQSLNGLSNTKYAAVRFGNVLGSRGSVIPMFKDQISRGGPITVTHPDMVRYFMTIPEAVQLVIQAGAISNGGEIFVLDMGKPVRILDLAENLIRLSGFEPHVDIPIEFTGIRQGEKLFEELLFIEEEVAATQHDRIFIGKLNEINRFELELEFRRLETLLFKEHQSVLGILDEMVPSEHRRVGYGLVGVP
ncbi:polysaccharide biosynthesis protein [Cohnella pontilimi]|uniref:Polysaccharide biosynthesis protein n=1 Tax=Cohnella pontilimi TaxID=2564100 RepID=A0A4U0FD71_9BACL|nr:nucleoside-diphosphate sugar epimerase/dehydratase [Cohnella pontilimi]TJY42765.1 polysaccharide biosynthesis protein [Cohnella pontilimi]